MGIFDRPLFQGSKKRDLPPGLCEKCPSCGELIHNLELQQNQRVCPRCDFHFTQTAYDRIEMLLDPDSFRALRVWALWGKLPGAGVAGKQLAA